MSQGPEDDGDVVLRSRARRIRPQQGPPRRAVHLDPAPGAPRPRPRGGRVLLQAQVQGGRELILGARTGPVLLVGLGGVHAEVLRDVALGVPPLTDRDAEDMLDGLRGAPLLAGYRGQPGVDRAARVDARLRRSALAEEVPRLAELDVNPLLALAQGAVVVDARARLE
ncbi:MAG: acetate--CoA ligase family protein [Planctomycetota bacterium]|nr:acetate--CoA ligase family protein [Planctomycetota bacterium]